MGRRNLCCTAENEETDPKKEICRLKLNWLFMTIIAALYAISYTSVSSSFHQFITNPREESINRSLPEAKEVEPGLGESEEFYSWVITVFNIGAVLGSLSAGLLLKWIPYWHLLLSSLCLHTLGYILYAVATSGWAIMLSKLMSGVYIGAEMTLALAYFGESSSGYKEAVVKLGKDERKANQMKHRLFALHSVGVNVGYVFGPGVAVIFAQFPINQFRSIAWYNVAVGLGILVTQIFIFRGESSCKKLKNCSRKSKKAKPKPKTSAPEKTKLSRILSLTLLIFLVVSRAVLSFRFCVYETLFNPILSDSFGFTERDASYFFFGLVAAQVCGTILLLMLQQLKLSNRLIAVIGLVMSIVGTILMGDWQAVRHDPCTDASLFHHPELLHTYTAQLDTATPSPIETTITPHKDVGIECEKLNLSLSLQQHLKNRLIDVYVYPNMATEPNDGIYGCVEVASCPECSNQDEVSQTYIANPTCLHLHVNPQRQCLERAPLLPWQLRPHPLQTSYSCSMPKSMFTYCLSTYPQTAVDEDTPPSDQEYIFDVHLQSVQIVEGHVELLASQSCTQHRGGHCHWNPKSSVTHRLCENCPPICRDRSNYLEFAQFTIGAAILLVAMPVARVPITSLISDIVSPDDQGILMGLAQALNAVMRSVGPLWLDAAYEGIGKRTFLAMALCLLCYFAILIGILLFYRKLAPPSHSKPTGEEAEESESDYTALQQRDSFSDSDFMP